ncbi:MAG: hypothetical protein K2K16_00740 [Ruminococcus sp.]|nr:hypothetical protein [Ruminococcus sp.]
MKKPKKLITSLALSALMAIQPIACYAVDEEQPETYSHTFEVSVVDMYNSNVLVGGIDARLVEYKHHTSTMEEPWSQGEYVRTIAEFTTSDTELTYITCDDVSTACDYYLEIDELPENYNYFGKSSVVIHDFGSDLPTLPYNPYLIHLENKPPYEVWEDFPVTKTVDWNVIFRDYTSMSIPDMPVEHIQGIDLEIARMTPDGKGGFTPVETLGNWNTSETDIIIFTTEETFNSEDDEIYFGFKFNAVPEEYEEALSGLRVREDFCDGYYLYDKYGYSVRTRQTNFYFTWKKSDDKYITTAPTTTRPTTNTTIVPAGKVLGDANGDGQLSLADAVLIMQALANPAEFVITPECAELADVVNKGDGLTPMDSLAIQMINIELLNASDLPITSEQLSKL